MNTPLYNMIDDILWHQWDPIGVNDTLAARDEYTSYIPVIYGLLKRPCTVSELTTHLNSINVNQMGLPSNKAHARKIAELLLAIKLK